MGAKIGGESHVMLIHFAPSLHHFLTLPEVPSKSYHIMSNEKPLIDYNKNIMMMSEHYLVIFEQQLVRKEVMIRK